MIPFIPFFLAAVVIHLAVYLVQCFRSPLRQIPGPAHASFTSLVLKWHELHANRTQYVHELHKKYGPSVRLSPDEVSFASYEAVKEIYCSNGSGYDKTEFYNLFRVYGRRTMFTTLNKEDVSDRVPESECPSPVISSDSEQHAKRKRILADRYANSNIMKPASLSGIEERSQKFMKRLQQSADKRESHDIFVSHAHPVGLSLKLRPGR
jgi:hypothetical protein